MDSLSAYRFPLPAPGGEPFAPPRGESAVTSWFARQLQNFDNMSSCTLTLPCTMCCRAHVLSRVYCTSSFVVRSGSAWSPNMFACVEGSFAARRCCFGRPPPQYVILIVSCTVRGIFSVMSGEICFGSFYVEETCNSRPAELVRRTFAPVPHPLACICAPPCLRRYTEINFSLAPKIRS